MPEEETEWVREDVYKNRAMRWWTRIIWLMIASVLLGIYQINQLIKWITS